MAIMTRWLASAVLAAGLGMAALSPTPAYAQSGDDLVRVIVDVADVIVRGGYPYYRYGNYGYNDRLIVVRDRYGRPVYYREIPRTAYRNGPPYGNAYGYWRNGPGSRNMKCNKHGKCQYYDARYDRRYDNRYYDNRYYDRYDNRYYDRYDNRYSYDRRDRYWDGRRWRYRDDD
ncbi:MAG TPA: hypothetical protein VGD21_10395 [Lysobacter sp.]